MTLEATVARGKAGGTDQGQPPAPRAEAVIELEDLSVAFGRHRILDRLRCSLGGRCVGLLGPNGAGKTTLIHTLLGFHSPSSGTARILGSDIQRAGKVVRSEIGYMPERDAFIAGMTGVRFVRMMAEVSGLPPSAALERAHEVFFHVGLGEARYRKLETYSLGMKQLAKLAQALVHGPRLIFLDEPTNGLDPPARAQMLRLIREIRDSGEARLVVSSHLLRDVEAVCDEVLVLKKGRVAVTCDLEEERRTHRSFLLLETQGGVEAFSAALQKRGCELAILNRRRLKLVLPEAFDMCELFSLASQHQVQLRRLDYKRDSLEDIFLRAMEDDDGRL